VDLEQAKRREWFWYDVHGIIRVASEVRLPELAGFRTTSVQPSPDIRVSISDWGAQVRNNYPSSGSNLHHIKFDEGFGSFGFGIDIEVNKTVDIVATQLLRLSPHVLYTNVVEPILRWMFVDRGYALVHGACIAFDNEAVLVTAKTDTGKTTTVLRILDAQPCSFLSDDLTIVCPDGRVLTYSR
jgi:hypothetical protein